jgi:hypothetical protein
MCSASVSSPKGPPHGTKCPVTVAPRRLGDCRARLFSNHGSRV